MTIDELFSAASIIPVLTVNNRTDAAPLADALASGGLRVIEMTLRSSDALSILADMKAARPDLIIGMGTVRTPGDVEGAIDAGADFLVSPGLTPALIPALTTAWQSAGIPSLPGIATVSEAMSACELGFTGLKFFPAEPAGGLSYLKALYGPLPDLRFCPTGGISAERAPDYLSLPNVSCVGGSWIAPTGLIETADWQAISVNAQTASALGSSQTKTV
ncbi:MAG: bifunctional 4-hydroxy-2-oxoglutarate aldolase/2-dehydro-3-deoxy-phosphogluconate aldolase [Maricaulis sp.]|jgi:2-dehydro-3-deoxyphosphogluconate aldolase/(4S)-4-hydroxy-2-oxoglutarate aldolase|nr:bifunctional 4-hydroxy-2-oxoglutarate aldolase/2-dehydro-3-deoxy-phosphogluconate aldolase [Maricaulis sp.]